MNTFKEVNRARKREPGWSFLTSRTREIGRPTAATPVALHKRTETTWFGTDIADSAVFGPAGLRCVFVKLPHTRISARPPEPDLLLTERVAGCRLAVLESEHQGAEVRRGMKPGF